MIENNKLLGILKDERMSQLDKLRNSKVLMHRMLLTKEPYSHEVCQHILSILEHTIKNNKMTYQFGIDIILLCFSAILQEPSKLLDQAYRCLYSLMNCPMESKLPIDRMYYVLAEATAVDSTNQDKFITMLRIVGEISEFNIKVESLCKKVAQKMGQHTATMALCYYLMRLYTKTGTQSIYRIHIMLANRYKNQFTLAFKKIMEHCLDNCLTTMGPILLLYLLDTPQHSQQALQLFLSHIYTDKILTQKSLHRLTEVYNVYGSTMVRDRRLDDMAPILLTTLICSTLENATQYSQLRQVINALSQQLNINTVWLLQSLTGIILCTDWNYKQYQIRCQIEQEYMCLVYLVIRKYKQPVRQWMTMVSDRTLDTMDMMGYLHQILVVEMSQEVYVRVVDYLVRRGYDRQAENAQLALHWKMCQQGMQERVTERLESSKLKFQSVQQIDLLRKIHVAMVRYGLENAEAKVDRVIRYLVRVTKGDKMMSHLADCLLQQCLAIEKPIKMVKKQSVGFLPLSYQLMKNIDFTVREDEHCQLQEDPRIERGVKMAQLLCPHASIAMKKVVGLRLDRPSQYFIKTTIIPNRFLMKFIQAAQLKNLLRNIMEILCRMQQSEREIETLFPDLPLEVKKQYARFIVNRNIGEFRTFLLDYPEHHDLASTL